VLIHHYSLLQLHKSLFLILSIWCQDMQKESHITDYSRSGFSQYCVTKSDTDHRASLWDGRNINITSCQFVSSCNSTVLKVGNLHELLLLFVDNCRIILKSNGGLEAKFLRPATYWVHYTTSCIAQSNAPEDGLNNCSKHVEVIGIINKQLLLHLVGCLLYYLY
jgi:hypothetical protein